MANLILIYINELEFILTCGVIYRYIATLEVAMSELARSIEAMLADSPLGRTAASAVEAFQSNTQEMGIADARNKFSKVYQHAANGEMVIVTDKKSPGEECVVMSKTLLAQLVVDVTRAVVMGRYEQTQGDSVFARIDRLPEIASDIELAIADDNNPPGLDLGDLDVPAR